MVGIQLGQLPNTTIDIEATQGVFLRNPGEILFPVNTTTWAMRVGWSSRRDKVRMNATGLSWGPDGRYGGLVRADAGYAPRDGLWLTLGGIVYRPGRETGPLVGLDTHDQLYVSARWSF